MSLKTIDTIIIGGGLSGVYAAYLLARENKSFMILEARDRLGGRILSPGFNGFHTDLGPSWYWPDINPIMKHLIQSLGLKGYRQFETGLGRFEYRSSGVVQTVRGYATTPASWRLAGGMKSLIEKLLKAIPPSVVQINSPVCELKKRPDSIRVIVGELAKEPKAQYAARNVILALPPRLTATTILFTPDLSTNLTQAMMRMGTWMAGQAKFFALYDEPFWRQAGLSGQAFSQQGPLGEIYDGSNNEKEPYGLTGFLCIPAAQRKREPSLNQAILVQLAAIYGSEASRPIRLYYQDWAGEKYTATEYDQPMMREHPVYQPPAGHTSIWEKGIQFAGSETASIHGGYLEGALESAQRAVMHC